MKPSQNESIGRIGEPIFPAWLGHVLYAAGNQHLDIYSFGVNEACTGAQTFENIIAITPCMDPKYTAPDYFGSTDYYDGDEDLE